MRRRIYDEIGTDFSGKICEGATFDDLDETAIENFRSNWIEKSGNKQLATRSRHQILIDCGAITDSGVTYAALILFGKNEALTRFLPQAEIVFEYRSRSAFYLLEPNHFSPSYSSCSLRSEQTIFQKYS